MSDAKIDICLHGHLKEGPVGYNMGRLPCRKGLATRKRDNSKIIRFSMVAFLFAYVLAGKIIFFVNFSFAEHH